MPRRDFSKVAFAATGDTNVIPTPTQPDGSISLQTGWGFDYQRDNGAGGGTPDPLAKNIDREDMNGILNEITASVGEIQQNGFPIWVSTAAPYPLRAVVRYTVDDKNYRSTISNNSTTPGTNTDWIAVDFATATETAQGVAEIATTAEVNTGTDDARIVTPLKLAQKLTAYIVQATELVFGWAKVATQAQTDAGTDDATIVTPKKLRWGLTYSLAASGYIALPSWMGGVILQWTNTASATSGSFVAVNMPTVFPNNHWHSFATLNSAANITQSYTPGTQAFSLAQARVYHFGSGAQNAVYRVWSIGN